MSSSPPDPLQPEPNLAEPDLAEPDLAEPDLAGAEPSARVTARDVAITAAIAIVLHLPALVRKAALNSDEATIATVARMMRHGAKLYTGAVDRKPPGAFVLFRLLEPLFGSWTLTAGRWVALVATVAAAWIIARESQRRWPDVSPLAVASLFIVAFAVLPAEDSRAVGFELLATLPAVAGFGLGARGRTAVAGIAIGIAALFKQPMLLGSLALAVQCLSVPATWTRRVIRLVTAGVACAATIVAGLAPFGLHNALSWFAGNGDNYLGGTTLSKVLVTGVEQYATVAVLTAGILVFAALAWGRRRLPMDLAVWTISAVGATAIGFRFVLHYFNQLLPALVLVAAPAFVGRQMLRRTWPRVALVCLTGAATFSMVTVLIADRFHDLPNVDRVAAAVRARTTRNDKIFVWGQAPEIYWLSERDPATRYPHVGFITGITPKRPGVAAYVLAMPNAAPLLLADLAANHPALIIDAAIENVRGGNRYPLRTSPIATFVAAGYCQVDEIDGMRLLSPCNPLSG